MFILKLGSDGRLKIIMPFVLPSDVYFLLQIYLFPVLDFALAYSYPSQVYQIILSALSLFFEFILLLFLYFKADSEVTF